MPAVGFLPIARCLVGRVRQFERNVGIKPNAESLVAELRVWSPDDHGSTGCPLKFIRPQSGQKLQRRGVVQIANGRVPDPHCYRITAARVEWLRDQQRRVPMGVLVATAAQPLKLKPLLSGARNVEVKLTIANNDCAACWLPSAYGRKQLLQNTHTRPFQKNRAIIPALKAERRPPAEQPPHCFAS
jgi:hypothetical protein